MRFELACILLLAVVAAIHAQADAPAKEAGDARSWFTTFTLILSTSTSTTTVTSVTTCTTSAAALTTCSAGRRRRGLFYDEAEKQGRARRGLFYNDEELEHKDAPVKRSAEPAEVEAVPSKPTVDLNSLIPLTLQSGFSLPEGFSGPPRFGLAFGTTTLTSTTISTSTSTLTATCASTTGYAVCASG